MFLSPYFQQTGTTLTVSPQQASDFAKSVASDFNPIHDPGAKRFCVPGDLLFSLILSEYGLQQNMAFSFDGMIGKGVELHFPKHISDTFTLVDVNKKPYLSLKQSGDVTHNADQIEQFVRAYVAFSGHNFIDILVPLMRKNSVMVNPSRPLVIYENMSFDLTTLNFEQLHLELASSELLIDGKRGNVALKFNLFDEQDQLIGQGHKSLILSSLREFDESGIQSLLNTYNASKGNFSS